MKPTASFTTLTLLVLVLLIACLQPALASPLHQDPIPDLTAPDTGEKVKVIRTLALEHAPGAIGVNPVTNRIYIANSANWLTVIDGATNEKMTSFFTGSRFSQQLGIDARRNRIYMANSHGNGLIVIDGETNTEIYATPIGSYPEGIGVDSDNRTVYVAHSGSVLGMLDAVTFQAKGFLYTAKYNHTIAVNPRLHRAYVALTDPYNTDIIDTITNTKIGFIRASGNADVNFVTGKLYMADYRYPYISVVDGQTNAVVNTISKDTKGGFVAVNPTTNCIYATNPDRNTVSVIDGRTERLVATVGVGSRPQQIAVNPANGLVYVSNTGAESVHVIQDDLCGREQRVWRLLYYLPGDNGLDDTQAKLVKRLERAIGPGNFHTSVLFDGPQDGDSRYLAIGETLDEIDKGELNTGDSRTLLEWINWSRETLPASYTALIVVGHGNLGGATIDEGAGSDSLQLREMRDVLASVAARYGRIDVLYMNSSLMGTIEGAYEVRPYVDYYVSSQNTATVGVDQLPSSYLNHMATNLTPRDLALDMGRSNAEGLRSLNVPFTVSVADLGKLSYLVRDVNDLSRLVKSRLPVVAPILRDRVLPVIQRFDMNGVDGIDSIDELVDLYDFADAVSVNVPDADVRDAAERIKLRLRDEYIIFEAHSSGWRSGKRQDLEKSHGVSIFFPAGPSSFYNDERFDFAAGADWGLPGGGSAGNPDDAVEWAPMLVAYVRSTNPDAPDNPEPPPLVAPADQPKRTMVPLLMR